MCPHVRTQQRSRRTLYGKALYSAWRAEGGGPARWEVTPYLAWRPLLQALHKAWIQVGWGMALTERLSALWEIILRSQSRIPLTVSPLLSHMWLPDSFEGKSKKLRNCLQNIRNIIIFAYKYYEISVLIIRQGIIFVNIGVIIITECLEWGIPRTIFYRSVFRTERWKPERKEEKMNWAVNRN